MKKLFECGTIVVSLGADCTLYVDDKAFKRRVYESDPNESFGKTLKDLQVTLERYAISMENKAKRVERYESKRELAKRAYASEESALYVATNGRGELYRMCMNGGYPIEGRIHTDEIQCHYDLRIASSYTVLGWLL